MIKEHQPLHLHHLPDLESIPNQIGHAILNSKDGSLLIQPSGSLSHHDIDILYQILLEVGETTKDSHEKLKKVTIEGNDVLYSLCCTADGFVFIVKKRAIDNHH